MASNAAEPDGVFALVLDEYNLGPRGATIARRLAVNFLEQTLQPNDYAAVLRSGGDAALLFSNSRERLVAVVAQTSGRGSGQPVTPAPLEAVNTYDTTDARELTSADGIDPADAGGGSPLDVAAGLEMVRLAVERLAVVPSRRKAVIWFNEGVGVDVMAALANPQNRTADKMREVVKAAFEGNVAIYPVDPRGLYTAPNLSRFRRTVSDGSELDAGGRSLVTSPYQRAGRWCQSAPAFISRWRENRERAPLTLSRRRHAPRACDAVGPGSRRRHVGDGHADPRRCRRRHLIRRTGCRHGQPRWPRLVAAGIDPDSAHRPRFATASR